MHIYPYELPLPFLRPRIASVDDFLEPFSNEMIDQAERMGADVLVFPDRPWMGEAIRLGKTDTVKIALLSFRSYDQWWASLRREARVSVKHPLKLGATVKRVEQPSDQVVAEILAIFKETPFRENRFFPGYYAWNESEVRREINTDRQNLSVVTTWRGRVAGVSHMRFFGQVAKVMQFLTSLEARRDCRGLSNLMMAKQVELLTEVGVRHIIYAKFGALPSLDAFKVRNGFRPVAVNYNHILLTPKAQALAKLGLHRRSDVWLSRYSRSIIPFLASLQRLLPPSLIMRMGLYA